MLRIVHCGMGEKTGSTWVDLMKANRQEGMSVYLFASEKVHSDKRCIFKQVGA